MAGLDTLIRVRRHHVDEQRRVLADLYAERDRVAEIRTQLDRDYRRERELVETNPEYRFAFAQYQEYYRERAQILDGELAELDRRVAEQLDAIREAFKDLKQLEITKRERDREAANERARQEQRSLDEAGITAYRRQGE